MSDPTPTSPEKIAPPHGPIRGTWTATVLAALSGDQAALRAVRHRIYGIIEVGRGDDKASKIFDAVIVTMILLNIAAFMAETVKSVQEQYGAWLWRFEIFSVIVFTLEYLARLWTAVEMPFLARLSAVKARLTLAKKGALVIDLLAILPFYLALLVNIDLRVLRVLRLIRFFKLSRYSPAMHSLIRVLSNEKHTLMGAGLLLIAAMLISSTGMYFLEHNEPDSKFTSVPESLYWAITTLTTVGYGDATPTTPLGKVWAGLTMVMGLCILSLPVAIIATGFAQEAGRRDFVVNWSLMSRIPLLAELDTTEIAAVMPLLHANNAPVGAEVIPSGAPGDAMFFIASGAIELQAGERRVHYATGDFFGAVALLEGDVSPGSFRAVSRARLLKLHREDFNQLERVNPAIGAHIRRVAAERRRQREDYQHAHPDA
jgi:voltage-gated potassium channel